MSEAALATVLIAMIGGAIRVSTPFMFVALGETITEKSGRINLGLETIDLYYVHNPETELSQVSRQEFYRRLKAAFAQLEKAVVDGKIRLYGTATWNAYRVGPDSRDAVSLSEVLRIAEEVGGNDHHFRALQLPFNLAMTEALAVATQQVDQKQVPALRAAQAHRLMVFSSASLLQGQLARGMPPELAEWFPGHATHLDSALSHWMSKQNFGGKPVVLRRNILQKS